MTKHDKYRVRVAVISAQSAHEGGSDVCVCDRRRTHKIYYNAAGGVTRGNTQGINYDSNSQHMPPWELRKNAPNSVLWLGTITGGVCSSAARWVKSGTLAALCSFDERSRYRERQAGIFFSPLCKHSRRRASEWNERQQRARMMHRQRIQKQKCSVLSFGDALCVSEWNLYLALQVWRFHKYLQSQRGHVVLDVAGEWGMQNAIFKSSHYTTKKYCKKADCTQNE